MQNSGVCYAAGRVFIRLYILHIELLCISLQTSKSHLALAVLACILGSPLQIGLNTAILNAPQENGEPTSSSHCSHLFGSFKTSNQVIKDFFNETYFDRYDEVMSDSLLTMLWAMTVALFCVGGMMGGVSAAYFAGKFGSLVGHPRFHLAFHKMSHHDLATDGGK
ncbi:solute carrier family 2, facilitated glucose transporter member 1-like [Biomphalaria glabrata]|uniref:Solute carrier family 2, facilitated glucose transporter member 1-like n=1 Tax=Biomphalaria glabrata TaxID=6526 RepID=A0A9W3A9H2_BIOGL|nr:solute carrier family 2, facilitated glucose transporter member 1-like [Biomphalaria glabrata]